MAIESELSGGCSAAVAISHADDAINKISLKAAATFAKIAGKNLFKLIESPSEPKISHERQISCRNRF